MTNTDLQMPMIRSLDPIRPRDWLEPVMNEFADEIAMLSDRISDHLIDDIERSFVSYGSMARNRVLGARKPDCRTTF